MSDVAITPTALALGTASSDILGAGTAITTAASNVFAIAAGGRDGDRLVLCFEADASGDTVTLVAGDRPPSQRADLTPTTITLAASDIKLIVVEAARYLQDDGTIRATCTDNGTLCSAFIIPKGI